MNCRRGSGRRCLSSVLLIPTLSAALTTLAILLLCAKANAAPSIKSAEYVPFDGAKLYLLVRGADKTAPVLLWLHGGPGGAERPLFRYFNGGLEKHFVVVYWDQRGAGRSFDAKVDPHCLTIPQHLADLDTVVDHLRQSLGQNEIVLIGHSWGAALGALYVQAHPEDIRFHRNPSAGFYARITASSI